MRNVCAAALAAAAIFYTAAALAADTQVERGKYLVTIAGCNDCHTPGYFLGKPDYSRTLAGSDVGFTIPGLGAFVGRNLTPDKETGLGEWTDDQIISAITAGIRPDKRRLAPIMPWQELSHLSSDDAHAIVAYLRSFRRSRTLFPDPSGRRKFPRRWSSSSFRARSTPRCPLRHEPSVSGAAGKGQNEKGAAKAPLVRKLKGRLLDLGFLELDVLARDRIIFLESEFLGLRAGVLLRDVEIAGVGGREQLDLERGGLGHGVASFSETARRTRQKARKVAGRIWPAK